MDVHVVFVPDTGTILGVMADPSSLESVVRGYFDAEEATAREEGSSDDTACWFHWVTFDADSNGDWEVMAVCGKHPDEDEPYPWQCGVTDKWTVVT